MPRCQFCKSPTGKGIEFEKKYSGQKHCLQNEECIADFRKFKSSAIAKKTKQRKAEEKKVLREKTKTLSDYKSDLQKEINAIAREIDKSHPCIATGALIGKRNSGHYMSVGSNPTIRFHLENIWNQSEHSNTFKSGDTLLYQEGIVSLYGQEYLDRLNRLKMIPPIKPTIEDLKIYISRSRSILKRLKDQNEVYSNEDRIKMRVSINLELKIYEPEYCVFNLNQSNHGN